MNKKRFLLSLLGFSVLTTAVYAESDTLKKIKETGVISLGVRESSVPFSYATNEGYVGYSRDIMQHIVEAAKEKLALPKLEIKTIPITSQNRISLLQNGTIDIECGSTTNNVERQQQASFTTSIFIVGTQLLTRMNSGINHFSDLKNKTVTTTAGTTSERILGKLNGDKKMGMHILSATDHGQAMLMLETGRADAFMMDDALLYGERAKAKNPREWHVVGKPRSYEVYGCMLRKGDTAFKQLADKTITDLMKSGKANTLYNKWFMQPIPPKSVMLNFPLSKHMKELYSHPSDQPYPEIKEEKSDSND
ncbi:MAG: glutamate/aspartate ABC transporter substrate-binding protein [Ottowia sp.]|nr:glutamate/aspartate ABC transporter substrate-binding protein [Ottowia sp.]